MSTFLVTRELTPQLSWLFRVRGPWPTGNVYPTTISLLEESMNVIAPVMALIVSTIGFSNVAF